MTSTSNNPSFGHNLAEFKLDSCICVLKFSVLLMLPITYVSMEVTHRILWFRGKISYTVQLSVDTTQI